MEKLSVLVITQARMGSSRLPNKVMEKIGDLSMLELHVSRLKQAKMAQSICVATTREEGAYQIKDVAVRSRINCFQGDTNDVLDRFYQAASITRPDYVVRLTSDCPLIDPQLIDQVVDLTIKSEVDYASNTLIESFPDGQDIEVFKFKTLEKAWKETKIKSDREHVTPYIRRNCDINRGNLFRAKNLMSDYPNLSKIRMTVDELSDLEAMNTWVSALGIDKSWYDYANYCIMNLELFNNQNIVRNEGYFKSLKNDD